MPYKLFDYEIKITYDEEDNDYVAFIEEIPEVSAFGDTPDKSIGELQIAYNSWLEICIEKGYPIPKPFRFH